VTASAEPPAPNVPSVVELFLAFFGISLMGFGGVIPWARWMVVEQRGWLTPAEFNEVMALAQMLPGGNIVNMAVILGQRYHGVVGSIAGTLGLVLGPFGIVIALASLYERFESLPGLAGALEGVSAAAVGLIVAMAVKMTLALRGEWVALAFATAAFVAVGVLRLPLLGTLAVLAPLSIGYAWVRVVRGAL
jgi:chromate transporter